MIIMVIQLHTQHLQVLYIEVRSLIQMLQQSTRCRYNNVHIRNVLLFFAEMFSTNHETSWQRVVSASNFAQHFESLQR